MRQLQIGHRTVAGTQNTIEGVGWESEPLESPGAVGLKPCLPWSSYDLEAQRARASVNQKWVLRVGLKTLAGCQSLEQNPSVHGQEDVCIKCGSHNTATEWSRSSCENMVIPPQLYPEQRNKDTKEYISRIPCTQNRQREPYFVDFKYIGGKTIKKKGGHY